jgi:hypothetical protein
MRSHVTTGVRQPIQGGDNARLITQRSQVQILSPLQRKPLSESLSVLRRMGFRSFLAAIWQHTKRPNPGSSAGLKSVAFRGRHRVGSASK